MAESLTKIFSINILVDRLFARASLVDICLSSRVNRQWHRALSNPEFWSLICWRLFPPQHEYITSAEGQAKEPHPISWKLYTIYLSWLEGVYESAVLTTGPYIAQKLLISRGTYQLQTTSAQGETQTSDGNAIVRLRSGASGVTPTLVLIDKQRQTSTEVELLLLVHDNHSVLRINGIVMQEEKYESKRSMYLGKSAEQSIRDAALERKQNFRRQVRFWSTAPSDPPTKTFAGTPLVAATDQGSLLPVPVAAPNPIVANPQKRQLYQMILGQLAADGLGTVYSLSAELGIPLEPPAHSLSSLVSAAHQAAPPPAAQPSFPTSERSSKVAKLSKRYAHDGLDFDLEKNETYTTKPNPNFASRFVANHKASVKCSKFSLDVLPKGTLVATGSDDCSVKLLDVMKMATYTQKSDGRGDEPGGVRPVLRTFYDHTQAVTDLDFHPGGNSLVTVSKDRGIRLFDVHSHNRKSANWVSDTHPVKSVSFHPSGDFLAVGTDHFMIRIYDVATLQPYVAAHYDDQHIGSVTQVRYSVDGKIYASAGSDGGVKVWDTVSNNCVRTIAAHKHRAHSVAISKNGKYLLSSGADSCIRLWEVGSGKQLSVIENVYQAKARLQAVFAQDEEFILGSDEVSNHALLWDTRTGVLVQKLQGHSQMIRWVASSPTEPAIMTCSDDHRARFWTSEDFNFSLASA